jgi:hypothetical protein
MQIYVFNRKNETWNTNGAVAIVAESQVTAEALYRQEFEFEFEVGELEITNGLMLVADGYDSTEMIVRHLTPLALDGAKAAATESGLYNCQVCGQEKCARPGICEDCLTPPTEEEIKSWDADEAPRK